MLAEITGEAHERALNEAGEASELIESLEQQLFDLRGEKSRGLVPIRKAISESLEVINELYKNKGKLPGIPTGFSELDKYIMGLNNSDLVLLAARPGIGKTSIALNIARNAAERSGKNTAIFNLEMSRVEKNTHGGADR
jgi:replicative DNA helicase